LFYRYNGQIPNGDRGRRKSKFQLRQRIQANGLKAQRQHLCKNADEVQVPKLDYRKKIKKINLIHSITKDIFDFKLLVDMVIGKNEKEENEKH
jgi:hypothetical protein